MNINIFQETNPVAVGNSLVGALYKDSAPTILLDHVVYTGPYTGQTQLHTFVVSQKILYRYICYESSDGTASGVIRNSFVIQPSSNTYAIRDNLDLLAGTTATMDVNGTTYGPDAALIGWNWYLERVAAGSMQYGVDWTKTKAGADTTIDDVDADGWRLLVADDVFQSAERFVVHFYPQLSVSTETASNLITQTHILTVDTTLDETALGNSFLLQGGGGFISITLPDITVVADNEPIYFISSGGSHINGGIFAKAGQVLQWYSNNSNLGTGTYSTYMILGQCESLAVYKFTYPDSSMRWIVLSGGEGLRQVGEQILTYSKIPLNTVFASGQLISRSSYRRLWDWVQSLDSSMLIPDSQFENTVTGGTNSQIYKINYGRFTLGDGSTTFRLPSIPFYGFQRLVQGAPTGRNAGSMEIGLIEAHNHTLHGSGGINGAGGPYLLARNLNGAYSNGGVDQFGRKPLSSGPDTTMRTGEDNGLTVQYETRPNNFGIYALIRC